MTDLFSEPLRGIIPPMVTPLIDEDTIDCAGLEKIIEHILSGGVSGLFILGTTGEGPFLSGRLRRELIDRVCRQVQKRVPIFVGITDSSMRESVELAHYAAQAGAAAVVAATPYYFRLGLAEVANFTRLLAKQVEMPLFLYNMPAHTKTAIPVDVVDLAMQIPNVVGLKDSSGDMTFFHLVVQRLAQRPEWTLLVGPEHLTGEAVLMGGHGGVNGGANLEPRLFVDLYHAAATGNIERLTPLQDRLQMLGRIYRLGTEESSIIKGLKCALHRVGLCSERMADPFEPFEESTRQSIERVLGDLQLI